MELNNKIFHKIDGFLVIKHLLFSTILTANMVVNTATTINLLFNKYKELQQIRLQIITS